MEPPDFSFRERQNMGNQPPTILLLIENSARMLSVWKDLRERCLIPFVENLVLSGGSVQPSILVMESAVDTTSASYTPRQYNAVRSALMGVKFSYGVDGRISPARIEECIQHLDGRYCNLDQQPPLHLVIVAASAPTNESSNIAVPAAVSTWNVLSTWLAERDIRCHLVMAPGEDELSAFSLLFEQTLVRQNCMEQAPPFPVESSRYIVRLSARSYQTLAETDLGQTSYVPANGITLLESTSRRNAYPPDMYDGSIASSSSSTLSPPNDISLVSHLKLAQGLIKKKHHAKDPQPAPFIADARVQEPTSSTYSLISPPSSATLVSPTIPSSSTTPPTLATTSPSLAGPSIALSSVPLTRQHRKPQPLSTGFPPNGVVHSDTIPSPTNGGRAMPLSKLDRMHRVNHAAAGSSPTEPIHTGRRGSQLAASGHTPPGWFGPPHSATHAQVQQAQAQRRGSRVSTPEQDAAMGSPASTVSTISSGSGSGSGSAAATVVGMPPAGSAIGLGLALGTGSPIVPASGPGSAASMSTPSLISTPGSIVGNGAGYHDMSPGSRTSYVSSDMSSPATPGSMDDLYVHARMQAAQHHASQFSQPAAASSVHSYDPDAAWQSHTQQQALHLQQSQEMALSQHQQWQEHHYGMQHVHQMQAIQHGLSPSAQPVHSHHPGSYDPSASTYFPPQRPPSAPTHYVGESAVQQSQQAPTAQHNESDAQSQNVSIVQHAQAMPHPQVVPQPYNPYHALAVPSSESPPPMVVPSQSHLPNGTPASNIPSNTPTTAINVIDAHVIPAHGPSGPTAAHGIPMNPPAQPTHSRSRAQATVAHGGVSKSSTSPARPMKTRKHRKTGSVPSAVVPHSAGATTNPSPNSTVSVSAHSSAHATSPPDEKMFHVSPMYAASTGVMFEATFNIKSSLLDGPSALANPEDVALVAPAFGMAAPDTDVGSDVLAKLPLGAVEAAGGLFQSSLRERGAVLEKASGKSVISVPTAMAAAMAPRGIASRPSALAMPHSSTMPPPQLPFSAGAYSAPPSYSTNATYTMPGDYGSTLSWSS